MAPERRFDPNTHYAGTSAYLLADTNHIKRKYLDIPYADVSPSQKLDIYLPDEGSGPFPVIVSIHGGAFMSRDKADTQVTPMLEGLKRGYAVVAANYRLSWEAIFPALVHDVKAVIRWIPGPNAGQYGFDGERIAAWGGSAGGYLSAMLGTTAGVPELEGRHLGNPDQPSHVQAVVDWYGPVDFLAIDAQLAAIGLPPARGTEHSGAESPESLLLGAKITEIPEVVRAANPATYIREHAPPFLIQHGTLDATIPFQQSLELAGRLREVCGEARVFVELLKDAVHGDPRFKAPPNVRRVLDFLDQRLK